jgi:hypothetical protein
MRQCRPDAPALIWLIATSRKTVGAAEGVRTMLKLGLDMQWSGLTDERIGLCLEPG